MNKRTIYNWTEIKVAGRHQFDDILILTYCLYVGYNKIIANSSQELLKLLHINKISLNLFKQRYLLLQKNKIISNFKCVDAQSYFNNPDFLLYNTTSRRKIIYLYILSNRHINNNKNYIPLEYIDTKLLKNPFVKVNKGKIHFIIETKGEYNERN